MELPFYRSGDEIWRLLSVHLAILIFLPFSRPFDKIGVIEITITGIATTGGTLRAAVFGNAKSFEKKQHFIAEEVIPVTSASEVRLAFPDLPPGRYAIAVFHDLNDNGILDTNALGIPTEPYGFSNNPAAKWSAPKFEEAAVDLSRARLILPVNVLPWRRR